MEKLLPFIRKFIRVTHLDKLLLKDKATAEMVETLYRRQNQTDILADIWCRRILTLLSVAVVCALLFVLCMCQEIPADVIIDGCYLQPPAGQNQVTFEVEAQTDAGSAKEQMTLGIGKGDGESGKDEGPATRATPDPREVLLSEIRTAVEEAVSADGDWQEADIQQEGALQQEKDLQYGGETPYAGKKVQLPEVVSGVDVHYGNPQYEKDFSAFYLGLFAICLFPFLWRRQRQEKLKERDSQLLYDYPELVNKLMLLLSAGLTVRGCFERMGGEYKKRLEEGGERRYVYEEICFSFQEMQNGVSEAKAIERFGRRCRQLPYLRFSSMMNQNIRKGSEGLVRLLEMDALEAFEKRKEQVKVMGETAGTKLLVPMVLMLGVVMAIIVIPAFMTM